MAERSKAGVYGCSLAGVAGSIPPIPVAEWPKARVCGQSLTGVAVSNPAGGHGYLCCVL